MGMGMGMGSMKVQRQKRKKNPPTRNPLHQTLISEQDNTSPTLDPWVILVVVNNIPNPTPNFHPHPQQQPN